MRILCVSDTSDSIVFSEAGNEYCGNIDLALSAGDMDLESYDYISTVYRCDTYYVYGNHNLRYFARDMRRNRIDFMRSHREEMFPKVYGIPVDGRCVYNAKHDLLIAGLGGSMLYNGGESQYSENQMKFRIAKLGLALRMNRIKYGRYLDILVTHAPPFGLGDAEDTCHRGFRCFLDFMDRFSPRYLIHGHIHLDDRNGRREYTYGKTKVINVFGNYIIDSERT